MVLACFSAPLWRAMAWPALLLALVLAWPGPASAEINYTLTYQGYLTDASGTEISGTRSMVFTIYDQATGGSVLWTQTKSVTVANGFFTVVLGETNSMVLDKETDYWLGMNVAGDGEMTPRKQLTAGMFSLLPNLGQQTVLVAKQNGDYATIGAALSAITDATTDNRYLIKVGPGVYEEDVTMKPWVGIQGSGQGVTIIKGDGFDLTTSATGVVVGADNSVISDLTVEADADSTRNHAVGIYNNNASPAIHDVTIEAHGATANQYGIYNEQSASPNVYRTNVDAYGGELAVGMYNYSSCNPSLVQVTLQGRDGSNDNYGLFSYSGCTVDARDCSFTASGSGTSSNVAVDDQSGSGSTFEQSTLSASGGNTSTGISVSNTASIDLRRCQVTAQSGSTANTGIALYTSSTDMTATLTKCQATASATNTSANLVGISASGSESPDYFVTITMDTVKLIADGGASAKGLYTYLSRVVGMSVWAAGMNAADSCQGAGAQEGELTLVNSVVFADGGTSPPTDLGLNGLYVNNTRAQLMNSNIVADNKGATSTGYGANQQGSDTGKALDLINCQVTGETVGVIANSSSNFNAGATQISGGFNSVGSGTPTCINCFTGGMATIYSNCTTTP